MAAEDSGAASTPSHPPRPALRRLIVNADDFGLSADVNAAVLQAHTDGILTTASLMVNEPGLEEAVRIARDNPRLGVGLHLSLVCGRASLGPHEIPGLIDAAGEFSRNPVSAGLRCFFRRSLAGQLRREIRSQLERFAATGLVLDHLNGHLHFHLHPTVLEILLEESAAFGIGRLRLTRDPLELNLSLARGRLLYRLSHAAIFSWLARRALPRLNARGIRFPDRVFGLLQNGRVDADYVKALLPRLPIGTSELYSHPSLRDGKRELAALTDPGVRELVAAGGVQLVRYQDF